MHQLMNKPDEKYVYHGSEDRLEAINPTRHLRARKDKEGNITTIFDDISFHATPYKWIALAYTYDPKPYVIDGRTIHYSMGVSLYNPINELITILGFESLEKSLEVLYGDGGWLAIFEKDKFFHIEGLGDLEVVTKEVIAPVKVERIADPVRELATLGISFRFVDLGKPENEARGY